MSPSVAARLPAQHVHDLAPTAPTGDYLQTSTGQVHRLRSLRESGRGKPVLYALHATAYSGRTFTPLMAELSERSLAALDAPGYGGSTRPQAPIGVDGYVDALLEAIDVAGERRIDLLGYHTGAIFAVEMAARRPDLVRRLVLIGVPYYPGPDVREERRRTLGAPMTLTSELAQFEERWDFFIRNRPADLSLDAGFAHFVDELRAYPHGFWAHEAAFTHDMAPALRAVSQPTLILNPANHLAEPSIQAAGLMRNVQVRDLPGAAHQVLDLSAPAIAREIEAFLGE